MYATRVKFTNYQTLTAIGFGIVYILSPVWIGETVRPELRGFYLCLMNTSIVVGQLLLAIVAKAISTMAGDWSHRTLILTQFAFCGTHPQPPTRHGGYYPY